VVLSMGLMYQADQPWQVGLRLRYFGRRALDSWKQQQSDSSTVVNASYRYQWSQWQVGVELLNLFNSTDSDIDYFYASRLAGEAEDGVEDRHSHPIEPRQLRLSLSYRF